MESPNRMAIEIVDEAIDFADEFGIGIHHLANEATCLDFGINTEGGIEAGLLLAEITTAGLTTLQTRIDTVARVPLTHVELATDHPLLSLLGCQYPGWRPQETTSSPASGPAQLLTDSDPFDLGITDDFDLTCATLETSTLPGPDLAETVASQTDVSTSSVYLLAVPVDSIAASVWAASLTALSALSRLARVEYDVTAVNSVTASAPIAPVAGEPSERQARFQAAIAHGGQVHLFTSDDTDAFGEVVSTPTEPEASTPGSPDTIVSIDGVSPAVATVDVIGGPEYAFGGIDAERLRASLGL